MQYTHCLWCSAVLWEKKYLKVAREKEMICWGMTITLTVNFISTMKSKDSGINILTVLKVAINIVMHV